MNQNDLPHVVLYQPEIPPNTGNVIRLCANTGFSLNLIEPLGFSMNEKSLRRAGLDYREFADISIYRTLESYTKENTGNTLYALSTKGTRLHTEGVFTRNTALLFGPESRGLPVEILDSLPPAQVLRVPMQADSRSLNLSNTVAIAVYEVWRQLGFPGSV